MHAALGFLLILTVHRCYPAGVPRCLQGNFIRRQIRQHFQTLIFIWIFAIVINLPLFLSLNMIEMVRQSMKIPPIKLKLFMKQHVKRKQRRFGHELILFCYLFQHI